MKADCVFDMIDELRQEVQQRLDAIEFLMTRIPEPPAPEPGATVLADLASVDYTAPSIKRVLSANARARISKAQKKRWAEHRRHQKLEKPPV